MVMKTATMTVFLVAQIAAQEDFYAEQVAAFNYEPTLRILSENVSCTIDEDCHDHPYYVCNEVDRALRPSSREPRRLCDVFA